MDRKLCDFVMAKDSQNLREKNYDSFYELSTEVDGYPEKLLDA